MVLNQAGNSIYLRKSATGKQEKDYVYCGKHQLQNPSIRLLKANKTAPIYYVLYEAEEGYLYGKVVGPDEKKAEEILVHVPTVEKSVYYYEDPKSKIRHYKIVATSLSPKLIMEKDQRQLNIIRIFTKTLVGMGIFLSIPLLALGYFFESGPLALVILAIFLGNRIKSRVPARKTPTMSSYDL